MIALYAVEGILELSMRSGRGIIGIVLVTLCIELAGCATLGEDARISQAESQGIIRIGMSESEVFKIVGRGIQPQDDYYENTTVYGKFVSWTPYSRLLSGTEYTRIVSYTFDFINGKLTGWSKINWLE